MKKNNLMWLRRLHGDLNDFLLDKLVAEKGYIKSLRKHIAEENYPIDFVVLWVDSNDPEWRKEKEKYSEKPLADKKSNEARFREWDLFKYWFRGVEKYAPWVNNVYLVTWGHIPTWLNIEHPKLKVIKHADFIPEEHLPVFNSNSIDVNLWRIPGLSEHFVYFCDDFYLTNPVLKNDFFFDGLPKLCALAEPIYVNEQITAWEHSLMNTFGLINSSFNLRNCMKQHSEKWFSSQYKEDIKLNKWAYELGYLPGAYISHLGVPFRKSAMQSTYRLFHDMIDSTSEHRFRTSNDITKEIYTLYEIFNGDFYPVKRDYYGFVRNISTSTIDQLKHEILYNSNNKQVCANDWQGITDEEYPILRTKMQDIMSIKYPEKSSFER